MGCAHDGDLGLVQSALRPDERERLNRLRRAPEIGDELRVAGGSNDRSARHGDRVYPVLRLYEASSYHLDDDRLHWRGSLPSAPGHPGWPARTCPAFDRSPLLASWDTSKGLTLLRSLRICEWSGFFVCSAIIDRSILTEYEADDVLVVREPEQLRALAGDVRARIVMLLRERAASTTELAVALGMAKGTVGHHLKVLERAGLIRVVATRRVRAVTEKYYGRVARLYVLKTDEAAEDTVGGGALAAVFLRQAAEEILPAEIEAQQITAGLSHARLLPADARRLGMRINRLFAAIQAADHPDGEPYGLAASLYPAPAALPRRDDDA